MLLGIIFLNTELYKPHFLRDEMIFMHCLLQIKQNINSNRHFSCSCSDTIYSKSIKKIEKAPFLKVYHFSISQHFLIVKVVVVQAVIAKFILIKNKLAPNR